jgi:hypothetical protein
MTCLSVSLCTRTSSFDRWVASGRRMQDGLNPTVHKTGPLAHIRNGPSDIMNIVQHDACILFFEGIV